jgi:hypothetical protein
MIIDNVKINCNIEISEAEARSYFNSEKQLRPNMTMLALDIEIAGDDVVLTPHYNTIVRVRRITGYLSNVKNFNSAKKSEQSDRVKHF